MGKSQKIFDLLRRSSCRHGQEEMKTLIFDNSAGRLQWISDREIYLQALEEFDATVRIDPHNRGLNSADWTFYRVRDEKVKEIADWRKHGSPAGAFPLR